MTQSERSKLPHAIYRLFDINDELIYIGMSQNPFATRLQSHGSTKLWARDIATARITWFPDWATARKAEAIALLEENSKYNYDKTQVLLTTSGRRPRGYGTTCPRCGKPKETPHTNQAYCKPCGAAYRRERRLARIAAGAAA